MAGSSFPQGLFCHTRQIAARRVSPLRGDGSDPRALAPIPSVFNGEMHVLQPTWSWPGGSFTFPLPPLDVVLDYLSHANQIMVRYAAQYGPCSQTLDGEVQTPAPSIPCASTPGQRTYSDAVLSTWVDSVAASLGLPPGDAVLVMNPPRNLGIINTDALISQRVGGYHGWTTNGYGYDFVNVNNLGLTFTLADYLQQYAQNVSHECQERLADPSGTGVEICDPCASNCIGETCNYFDANGKWLGGSGIGSGPAKASFYVAGVYLGSAPQPPPCPNFDPAPTCLYAPP